MPRSPTILTPPPGILPFTPNTTIRSQDANALFNDLYQDGNTPRPIVYGGTGANNALDALNNLGAISQGNFLGAYSIGDFYDTVRTLDGAWLKRDGSLHLRSDYPELSNLLPSLPDGISWRSISGLGNITIRKMLAEVGRIILVTSSGSDTDIYSSVDGQTFSTIATISSFSGKSIAKGNGIYVMVASSGSVCISNNAIDWSSPSSVSSNTFTNVYFGGGLFVAIGVSGTIYTSPDGIAWTSRTSGTSQTLWSGLYGNSLHLITGDNGTILTSVDGSSWTSRSSGTTNSLFSSAYGDGIYVVTGFGGVMRSSPDGTAWTARTSGVSSGLLGVTYSSSGFLAVGQNGTAILSANGTTWTQTITGVSAFLDNVVFDPGNPSIYYASSSGNVLIEGTRTLPTQFKTPSDSPQYGWIKALEEAP